LARSCSLSGVDSIAQAAAGRCNREGKLIFGELHVFDSDRPNEGFLKSQVQAARGVTDAGADPLTLDSVATYFQHYDNGKDWDREGIGALTAYPYDYQFKEIQANFDVIDDFGIAVIIPYDARARALILELARAVMGYNPASGKPLRSVVPRRVTRGLQRYVVQLWPQDFADALQMFPNAFQILGENEFVVLTPAGMTRYSPLCGLIV
jgi:hypothetical protein